MKPLGDLYTDTEDTIYEKYKNNQEVLTDIKLLTSLLSSWYITVFLDMVKKMNLCPECTKLTEVVEKMEMK